MIINIKILFFYIKVFHIFSIFFESNIRQSKTKKLINVYIQNNNKFKKISIKFF